MRISYAIPVCNEIKEIKRLLEFLIKAKRRQDEIVILVDEQNGTEEVKDYVEDFAHQYLDFDFVNVYYHPLNRDFAAHKNFLNGCCKGDYIFQIDADELPDESLLEYLPEILELNAIDAIWIPRINIVNGITPDHIAKWGWNCNENGWINWPNDAQLRVYANKPEIKWERKVHERLTGYKTISKFPDQKEFALWHVKDIARQERQNEFYETI